MWPASCLCLLCVRAIKIPFWAIPPAGDSEAFESFFLTNRPIYINYNCKNAAFNFIIRITFSTRVPDFFKHNKKQRKCISALHCFYSILTPTGTTECQTYWWIQTYDSDVTTGATGAIVVAPKFSDTLTLYQPRGVDSAHHRRGRS